MGDIRSSSLVGHGPGGDRFRQGPRGYVWIAGRPPGGMNLENFSETNFQYLILRQRCIGSFDLESTKIFKEPDLGSISMYLYFNLMNLGLINLWLLITFDTLVIVIYNYSFLPSVVLNLHVQDNLIKLSVSFLFFKPLAEFPRPPSYCC